MTVLEDGYHDLVQFEESSKIGFNKEGLLKNWIKDELIKFEIDKKAADKKNEIEKSMQPHKNILIESRRSLNNPTAANSIPTNSEDNLHNLR